MVRNRGGWCLIGTNRAGEKHNQIRLKAVVVSQANSSPTDFGLACGYSPGDSRPGKKLAKTAMNSIHHLQQLQPILNF